MQLEDCDHRKCARCTHASPHSTSNSRALNSFISQFLDWPAQCNYLVKKLGEWWKCCISFKTATTQLAAPKPNSAKPPKEDDEDDEEDDSEEWSDDGEEVVLGNDGE